MRSHADGFRIPGAGLGRDPAGRRPADWKLTFGSDRFSILAALAIIFTGWTPIDPILSVMVLIIPRSAWAVVRESGHILLEGAPAGIDRRDVTKALMNDVPGIRKVDHIHAWSVTQERPMITLEIEVSAGEDAQKVKSQVKDVLKSRFKIDHSTVEIV
ncbi:hypothetical protein [Jannaschia helgolandensis]|uniref:cation transporter dimerization domain-containing protein n=1 Tax=Jannaschia helgolandensis TaxID=188906 RepID=UPI0030D787B3